MGNPQVKTNEANEPQPTAQIIWALGPHSQAVAPAVGEGT